MRDADIPHLAPTASPQSCRHRRLSESGLGTAAIQPSRGGHKTLLCPLQLGTTHEHCTCSSPRVALGTICGSRHYLSLCSPSVPAAAQGISLSPWGWRGGDVGTEEMLCQDATCSRDPRTDSTEPVAVGGGGRGGDEPGITAGSSWHHPLQPLDQHHPSGTQHAVPSQPWLLWHSDTYQLCGMQVPPWQLRTVTPTAKIPPGTSCCLTCCCCICAAVAGCAI